VINQAALDCMKGRNRPQIVIDKFIALRRRFRSSGTGAGYVCAFAFID
jgi:hypothetical protein